MRTHEFSRQPESNSAVQCGPFLVDLGRRVRGLEEMRESRRTFAAVAKSDRAALGFCSEISLARLAEILGSMQLADDFTDRVNHLAGPRFLADFSILAQFDRQIANVDIGINERPDRRVSVE